MCVNISVSECLGVGMREPVTGRRSECLSFCMLKCLTVAGCLSNGVSGV